MAQREPRPSRRHNIQVRLNDREKGVLERLAKERLVSESEAVRTLIEDAYVFRDLVRYCERNGIELPAGPGIRRGDARTQGTKRGA